MAKAHRNSLAPGHQLLWYEIVRILGQGGFGITYLARDMNLNRDVAIKEYLPIEFAVREGDATVHPISEDHAERYDWGLKRFMSEARTLSRFRHPSIVRVDSVFEENNSGYMVMQYEDGISLQDKLSGAKTLDAKALQKIVEPLLDGLEQIHQKGFIHRDIKPDNIYLREDGSPVLLDFGSARHSLGEQTKTLTSLVSPGYAPFEQYYSKSDEQGAFTDIYGLGATLYRAVTGKTPTDAIERSKAIIRGSRDTCVPAYELARGKYPDQILHAIDHAIRFRAEERPQTIAEWRGDFAGTTAPVVADAVPEVNSTYLNITETEVAEGKALEVFDITRQPDAEERVAPAPSTAGSDALETPAAVALAGEDPAAPAMPDAQPVSHRRRNALVMLVVVLVAAGYFGWQWLAEKRPAGIDEVAVEDSGNAEKEGLALEQKIEAERLEAITAQNAALKAKMEAEALEREKLTERAESAEQERRALEQKMEAERLQAISAQEAEIRALLEQAERDREADRLSTPAGNNAYEKYKKVLELAPGNVLARAGLEQIVQRYYWMFEVALGREQVDEAAGHLQRIRFIRPDSSGLAAATQKLDETRERLAANRRQLEQEKAERAADAERAAALERKRIEEEQAEKALSMSAAVYDKLKQARSLIAIEQYDQGLAALRALENEASLSVYERAQVDYSLAYALTIVNDYGEAIRSYENILRQDTLPVSLRTSTLFSLAQIHYDMTEYRASIAALKKAYQLLSENAENPAEELLQLMRANYQKFADKDNLLNINRRLVSLYPKTEHWLALAETHATLGQHEDQVFILEKLDEEGELSTAQQQVSLANLHILHGDPARAVEILEKGMAEGLIERSDANLLLFSRAQGMVRGD